MRERQTGNRFQPLSGWPFVSPPPLTIRPKPAAGWAINQSESPIRNLKKRKLLRDEKQKKKNIILTYQSKD
jgi:hypothetical protein